MREASTKMVDCIQNTLVNPFDISMFDGEKMPLVNIARGAVPAQDVTRSLLPAKEQGKKAMTEFVEDG